MKEPTLEGLVKSYTEGGWSALEDADKQARAQQRDSAEAQYDIAQKYAATFATIPGRAVLESLLDTTLRRTTWDGTSKSMSEATAHGLFREGQNSVVAMIVKYLSIAKQGPPAAEDGE